MHRSSTTRLARTIVVLAGLAALLALGTGSASAANKLFWGSEVLLTAEDSSTIGALDAVGNGTGGTNIVTSAGSARGTVVDAAAGRIYWLASASGSIRYANLDGTGQGTLAIGAASVISLSEGFPQSFGLTLNPATGTLYWSNMASIQYAKTNGSGGGTLYDGTDPAYASLFSGLALVPALDPAANRIYWSQYVGGGIAYANLDGSGGGGMITPSGCATPIIGFATVLVNPAANALYLMGALGDGWGIQQMRLDGTQCQVLLDNTAIPSWDAAFGATLDPTSNRLILSSADGPRWLNLADRSTGLYDTGAASANANFPSFLVAPAATVAPVVTPASSLAGTTLSCGAPTWSSGIPGANVAQLPATTAYSWTRNGTAISGATTATLKTTQGGTYACIVTGTNAAGPGATASAAVTVTDPTASATTPKLRTKGASVVFKVTVTGPGVVKVTGTVAGSAKAACTITRTFTKAGSAQLRCIPSAATQKLRKKGPVRIKLTMTFTPTGGAAKTSTLGTVTLAKIKTRPPAPVTG